MKMQYLNHEKKFFVRVGGKFPSAQALVSNKYDRMSFTLLSYDPACDSSLLEGTVTHSFKESFDKNVNSRIRNALKDLNFPVMNDLANGGHFVGNVWLENQNRDEPEIKDIFKAHNDLILQNHLKVS